MEWRDEALVLAVQRYGEADALMTVLTPNEGKARGFVRGGSGKRARGTLQPGNSLMVTWRARIEDSLGRFSYDLVESPLGSIIASGKRLSALSAGLATVQVALPEREKHEAVYRALQAYIAFVASDDLRTEDLGQALVKLELGLLADLGYGLALDECGDTGLDEDLVYVSPRTGRAICARSGKPYRNRLLALPPFLRPETDPTRGPATRTAVADALRLTAHFLDANIWQVRRGGAPDARARFAESVGRVKG